MKKKKVLFVGTAKQQRALKGWKIYIERHGWITDGCSSIEKAQRVEEVDVMVVMAYGKNHVKEFARWSEHPPTIWFCIGGPLDTSPEAIPRLHGYSSWPADLLELATELAI